MPTTPLYPCPEPDFSVRAVPDNQLFPARRDVLAANSDVFRDMFSCCNADEGRGQSDDNILDLHETATLTGALLSLIHEPPQPPVVLKKSDPADGLLPKVVYDTATVVPFPVLSSLFSLADKYALSEAITDTLKVHVLAHAPDHPLQVYGLASSLGLNEIASKATQYLKPLAEYTQDEITSIPSVSAYHRILQLQDFRVKSLRSILSEETVFPHGYGSCSQHLEVTMSLWETTKTNLALKIHHLTDVAGEMESVLELSPISSCSTCRKSCIASIDMLRYKCRRVPKEVSRLGPSS